MKFVPGLGIAARPALSRHGGGGPGIPLADTKVIPAGILPAGQADFTDLSDWQVGSDWSDLGGSMQKSPGAVQQFLRTKAITIPAGDLWIAYSLRNATAGTAGVQLQGTFINTRFQNKATGQHVARFNSVGHTNSRLIGSPPFDGTIDDMQLVDMTAILAQPADIYIAAGQSLIAAESTSTPVDPDKDFWLPRCLFIPGSSNNTFGAVEGEVSACVAPMQMKQTTQGVSPASTFARFIEPHTPAGRNVLILGCATGGSSLIGPDAEWNPDGTVGDGATLYDNMVSCALDALALNPGNVVKGMIWGQGESDRSATIDVGYPPAFANMLTQLRSDISVPSLPVILIGPMPDDAATHQPLFIAMQEKLDETSGDATAITGVHYVARPSGYLSGDGTHPIAEGNRVAGRIAGQRFVSEGYL